MELSLLPVGMFRASHVSGLALPVTVSTEGTGAGGPVGDGGDQ